MKPEGTHHWTPLISRIIESDAAAIEEFYISLRDMRFYFEKRVGEQLAEDAFHDMFLYVISRIQAGVLREPERILGYVHAVARAQCFESSRSSKKFLAAEDLAEPHDSAPNPEDQYRNAEVRAIALRVLESMPAREREVLIRFYLGEQTPDAIQRSLELTATQFRVIKSRAKLRFEELCGTAIARKQIRHSGRRFDRASPTPLFKEPVARANSEILTAKRESPRPGARDSALRVAEGISDVRRVRQQTSVINTSARDHAASRPMRG